MLGCQQFYAVLLVLDLKRGCNQYFHIRMTNEQIFFQWKNPLEVISQKCTILVQAHYKNYHSTKQQIDVVSNRQSWAFNAFEIQINSIEFSFICIVQITMIVAIRHMDVLVL